MELNTTYKNTEMGIIPMDWEVKKLGDIGDVKMCRRIFNNETKSSGTIPFYKIGTFGKEADSYISRDLYNNYRRKFSFPNKGDILISAAGTIGRTIIYDGKEAYFQDSNIIWIENNQSIISNNFLYHTLQVVKYNTEGGTIQRLYNSILKDTKFLCPSPPEQPAIATALNDADSLITQLEKLIAKKRNIKQGAMQELLKPKEGWKVKTLNECLELLTDFEANGSFESVANNVNIYDNENFAWYVRATDLEKNSDLSDVKFVNENTYKFLKKTSLNGGEVLITKRGEIGKLYFFQMKTTHATLAPNMYLLKLKKKIVPFYVYSFFRAEIGNKLLREKNASSTLGALYKDDIKSIQIPFPSTYEAQTQIAQTLSDMDTEIAGLEKQLEKYKRMKVGMMQNLLTGKIRLV